MRFLNNVWWRFVFWWKKRTGWLDLDTRINITGTVVAIELPDLDGDQNFDVRLDPGFGLEIYITGFGGRLTTADVRSGPSLHCEIPPWARDELRKGFEALQVGDRVHVAGAWGFDGVHTPGRPEWLEVLLALARHAPNVRDGWFEIHPVDSLEVLSSAA